MAPRVKNQRHEPILADDIYVGRPSIWGNPYNIGVHYNRAKVITKYEEYIKNNKELLAQLHELRGKNLVCWCAPLPCHADILLKLANSED